MRIINHENSSYKVLNLLSKPFQAISHFLMHRTLTVQKFTPLFRSIKYKYFQPFNKIKYIEKASTFLEQ